MFGKQLFIRISASLLAILFLTFAIATGLVLTVSNHVNAMPEQDQGVVDHSSHLEHSNEYLQAQQHTIEAIASHASNLCASLCQANTTTTTPNAPLPSSEQDKEDELFNEFVTSISNSQKATDEPEPVYKARKLKVPLYIKHCLLRL